MWNNGRTVPPGFLQYQSFHGNTWFTKDLCGWPKQTNVFIWANVTHPNREWERNLAMISFAMHVVPFVDPSMNRADSVPLMQIALAHSSLAYLQWLFICLRRRKTLVNVTRGEKLLYSGRGYNQPSHPTVPKWGEGRQALSVSPPLFVSHPVNLSETGHILKYPYGKGIRRGIL